MFIYLLVKLLEQVLSHKVLNQNDVTISYHASGSMILTLQFSKVNTISIST